MLAPALPAAAGRGDVLASGRCAAVVVPQALVQDLGQDGAAPKADSSKSQANEVIYAVEVNGKVRAKVPFKVNATKEELEEFKKSCYEIETVKKFTEGKTIVKTIVVPNKIVNIVVK